MNYITLSRRQAINYPTVPRGQEKLRIAPTPHHTVEMMDRFTEDLTDIWRGLGLPLRPSLQCAEECIYCKKPKLFDSLVARDRSCSLPNCPQVRESETIYDFTHFRTWSLVFQLTNPLFGVKIMMNDDDNEGFFQIQLSGNSYEELFSRLMLLLPLNSGKSATGLCRWKENWMPGKRKHLSYVKIFACTNPSGFHYSFLFAYLVAQTSFLGLGFLIIFFYYKIKEASWLICPEVKHL